eukprot:631341-Pyramimonas_sp.AAC.1
MPASKRAGASASDDRAIGDHAAPVVHNAIGVETVIGDNAALVVNGAHGGETVIGHNGAQEV